MKPVQALAPTILALCLVSLGACASSDPQEGAARAEVPAQPVVSEEVVEAEIAWRGVVTALDADERLVTLDGDDGGQRTFRIDDQVQRMDRVQVGDEVEIYYRRALVFDMQPAGSGEPGAYIWQDEQHPDPDRPGVVDREVVVVLSPLLAIDTSAHTITVQAPNGSSHVLHVEQPRHREAMTGLQVGDLMRIQFRKLLAVRVTSQD